ncbi:hypothetical protein IW140_005270 [Coemansia sp. RSA 1813]|nr:hypothetical protein IW138_005213 [Coemansia sp. RSA 986]KAJ2211749.1 hypothetical protein EV179_005250 [Coemansia sp. RSA 487]KAJ2565634.1 hypothetical protein IW140_005270 [Coemansia sp. RSA 1813]
MDSVDFGFDWDTADNDLLEPMVEDKQKELEVEQLEHKEENLGPFEVFCQRAASVYIYQRVWAAKEVGRLLTTEESHEVAIGELIPIAKRLAEDNEVFVRETMAQNLEPVLEYYYGNHCRSGENDDDDFGAWLHRVLLTPHTSVSLPTQRAVVALGKKLSFDTYHTEIVHGVILGLVQNPVQQHLQRQRRRTKDMVVKSRMSDSGDSTESDDDLDISAVLEEETPSKQTIQTGSGFFVSPADDEARVEQTRRKLLMLHMIHLVAAEFGAAMRPAVFVPVVERAAKDSAFEVRRDAAAVLGSLAKAVSADLAIDVLFPCFQRLAQDTIWQVRQSTARHALPGLALVLAARTGAFCETSNEAAEPYAYKNQIQRSIADKQWLQLIERLTGPREQSQHVRAAVFESIGRLALALVDCPRSRDALVALVLSDVSRTPSHGIGSSTSLRTSNDDDNDDYNDDEGDASISISISSNSNSNSNSSNGNINNGRPPARTMRAAVTRDVVYQCAYNFPALLASLGPSGWDRLRDVYMQLSKSDHHDARQTLASSLHEVARILAESNDDVNGIAVALNATRLAANRISSTGDDRRHRGGIGSSPMSTYSADLESVLCLFLIDAPDIKMAALRNLGDALAWLTPASRVRCLPMIMQVFKHDGKQWRTREMMACQLVKLCQLFPASTVVSSLLPLAVEWAHDPVAGVRAAVAPAFPIVFELTKLDPSTQVRFFETVISFSHAASFRGRLFFVEICAALLAHDQDPEADPVDFDQFFLPSLAALAADRVANVRIALARLVRRMLENRERRHSVSVSLSEIKDNVGTAASSVTKAQAHRSVDSMPRRRARRNTTPMRAHLLATMLQQLSSDKDRDVQDIISSVKKASPKKTTSNTPSNVTSDNMNNSQPSLVRFPQLSDETSAVSLPETL